MPTSTATKNDSPTNTSRKAAAIQKPKHAARQALEHTHGFKPRRASPLYSSASAFGESKANRGVAKSQNSFLRSILEARRIQRQSHIFKRSSRREEQR